LEDHSFASVPDNYDILAEEYASKLFRELEHKPFDRGFLDIFVPLVAQHGEVCDMGCGPGHVTRYLHVAGANVWGLDLSQRMVEIATRLSPDIRFRTGNMMSLDIAAGSLAGICAFYAIVNIPEHHLTRLFSEMARVLQPDGVILLAFHIGSGAVHVDELWGKRISLPFYFFNPESIKRYLAAGGLEVEDMRERTPYAPSVEHQSRRAYMLARKPSR
jgi:SAM-dependent methyltransferase